MRGGDAGELVGGERRQGNLTEGIRAGAGRRRGRGLGGRPSRDGVGRADEGGGTGSLWIRWLLGGGVAGPGGEGGEAMGFDGGRAGPIAGGGAGCWWRWLASRGGVRGIRDGDGGGRR